MEHTDELSGDTIDLDVSGALYLQLEEEEELLICAPDLFEVKPEFLQVTE